VEGPQGVTVYLPTGTVLAGEQASVTVAETIPDPPEGLAAAGPAYEVRLPERAAGQPPIAFVRLPLPDPSVASDPTKVVLVGRWDGSEWEVVPAEVENG
jgi:hypothetical protein